MARDILAIPVSTVASESAFSWGRRIIEDARSSLKSDTVEALLCTKDWLPTITTLFRWKTPRRRGKLSRPNLDRIRIQKLNARKPSSESDSPLVPEISAAES